MRRLTFNQYEFDSSDSEQFLEIAVSTEQEHSTITSFLQACGVSAPSGIALSHRWEKWHSVTDNIRRFGQIELPHPAKLQFAQWFQDSWNEVEVAFAFDHILIWYHWETSA